MEDLAKRRERERLSSRRYRERHPEKAREVSRLGQQRYRERYPERAKATLRSSMLKRFYGISIEEYNALLSKQEGKCAICETSDPGNKIFGVDHDHETGKIRGLLCGRCNCALGHFNDNIETMKKAIQYVERHG